MMTTIKSYRTKMAKALSLMILALSPTLLPGQVRVPGFSPSSSGLHFANAFPNVPLLTIDVLGIQVPLGNAANGMCGGMVFTVRDYHTARLPVPCDRVPPTGGVLFDYLVRRLFDSFNLPFGPATYMHLMDPALPDHETLLSQAGLAPHGRAWVMIREQWPKIRADLDSGLLSPMALIRVKSLDPFQMGHNHQVLAYGYDLVGDDLTIYVYDPNHPDDDHVTIALNIGAPEHTTDVTYNGGLDPDETMYCFFRPDYLFSGPPLIPDVTPPVLQGPSALTVSSGTQCSRPVFYTVNASDDCVTPVVQCVPPSGATFPAGTTTVNCRATDAAGNIGSHTFTVTVIGPPPSGSPGGMGLLGTYYDNSDFSAPATVRVEAVNFDWAGNPPVNGVGADTFSVRWAGQIVPRYTDTYTFSTISDDGVRLWVNGQLIIDHWTDHPPTEDRGVIDLVAGQRYDIVMDYYENGGYATARLFWSSLCQPKEIVPAEYLFPAAPECPSPRQPAFFSNFNSNVVPGLTLFGAANVAGGFLQLTPAQDGQFGIAYIGDFSGAHAVLGFHATFKAALFGSTCCGNGAWPADGFSFNLVPAASAPANPGYGDPAEEGAATGLAVTFDTWDNGSLEAPAIDVKWLGQTIAHAPFQASLSPNGVTDPVAASREVVIDLEPGGAISVSYGGTPIFQRVQTPYNASVIGVPKWILGARTGAANDNHWIDDLRIAVDTGASAGIPGLFNTGVDAQGRPLPDNAPDPHYRLLPAGGSPALAYAATASGGFPIGPWLGDDPHSAWISPTTDTFGPGLSDYRYQIQFNLTGLDPATAVIQGQWAADNFGLDILINNVSTGQSHVAPGPGLTPFTTWQPFVVSSGFKPGTNTLTFVVRNDGTESNPTGLRVEMCGRAVPVPQVLSIVPEPVTVTIDLNGDGLDDRWQRVYNATGLNPDGDDDHDGVPNRVEALAGTNPFDAQSCLRITSLAPIDRDGRGGEVAVTFASEPGKRYAVEATADLRQPQWTPVGNPMVGAGPLGTVIVPRLPGASCFFRITVSDIDSDGDGVSDWAESRLSGLGL